MKNKELLDLYSDYLISAFGQTTGTGLAGLLNGSVGHDLTHFRGRFLNPGYCKILNYICHFVPLISGLLGNVPAVHQISASCNERCPFRT